MTDLTDAALDAIAGRCHTAQFSALEGEAAAAQLAREDVPALLAALRAARAEREALREFMEAVRDYGYDAAVEVLGDPLEGRE